jgi:hypothetical protein
MANKTRKPKITSFESLEDSRNYVIAYAKQLLKFKNAESVMNDMKADFNASMNALFEQQEKNLKGNSVSFETDGFGEVSQTVTVTQITKISVIWDIPILKRVLGKKLAKKCVSKKYEIVDFPGMVEYLKSLGAKPDEFSKFLNVTESVNEKQLDKLNDLGVIAIDNMRECYTVKKSTPYFKITVKSGEGNAGD